MAADRHVGFNSQYDFEVQDAYASIAIFDYSRWRMLDILHFMKQKI